MYAPKAARGELWLCKFCSVIEAQLWSIHTARGAMSGNDSIVFAVQTVVEVLHRCVACKRNKRVGEQAPRP